MSPAHWTAPAADATIYGQFVASITADVDLQGAEAQLADGPKTVFDQAASTWTGRVDGSSSPLGVAPLTDQSSGLILLGTGNFFDLTALPVQVIDSPITLAAMATPTSGAAPLVVQVTVTASFAGLSRWTCPSSGETVASDTLAAVASGMEKAFDHTYIRSGDFFVHVSGAEIGGIADLDPTGSPSIRGQTRLQQPK